tara:strand:- start:42 stop:599 length:558 start_codon:yes stop_codon:yes gene_type:complete
MKKILWILFIVLILNACSKKPKTAYLCYDPQTFERKFVLMYDYPMSRIISNSDWKHNGISNFNKDFWNTYRKKPLYKDSEFIIEYFDYVPINRPQREFIFTKGENKGNTINLPLINFRNIYFNTNTKEFQVYEYQHPSRVSLENLKASVDNYGLDIYIIFQKKFKCEEDKALFEAWISSGEINHN